MSELELSIKTSFGVNNEELEIVTSLFRETTLNKGDYFTQEGGYCEKLSFIKSGLLRVFAYADGKEITQWISTKNYFVTDLSSLLFRSKARWNIQALTDCELLTIEKENYQKLSTHIPRWHELEKQFIAHCFITLENRVFSHLSLTAEERYNYLFQMNPELFNQVPLQYLASMLGMTPETFSRIRSKKSS